MRSLFCFSLLFLCLAPLTVFANQERLAGGEILVTTEDVSGSEVPRITVVGVVNAAPERIWAIVSDCNTYKQNLPRIDSARLLRREGSNYYCEVTVDLPFPMSNLTAQTRATHTVGPPEWKREWTLLSGDYQRNDGAWILRPFQGDSSRTLVTYIVHAEPNNRVPNAVRRRAQESSMPGVIERLRELTE